MKTLQRSPIPLPQVKAGNASKIHKFNKVIKQNEYDNYKF